MGGHSGLTVPRGLVALRRLFYALNGHMEEGIFRLAGSETECQKMQASLNKPRNVDKQGNFSFDVFPNDVHAVSSLIKVPLPSLFSFGFRFRFPDPGVWSRGGTGNCRCVCWPAVPRASRTCLVASPTRMSPLLLHKRHVHLF